MQAQTLWRPYTQMHTEAPAQKVHSTDGTHIILENGTVLVDGMASWWTACHGYNPPSIVEAIARQLHTMPHVMLGGLVHEPAQALSKKLSELLPQPLTSTFFSESGSVAVEVAVKMALQYWINKGCPNKKSFIHFEDAYHGDTFYAMSLSCPKEGMHRLFNGHLHQHHLLTIPKNPCQRKEFEAYIAKHSKTIAGLIIEPLIQGAGGMKTHSPDTLDFIVECAQAYDVLVIFDEIFTGFGRTGTLFAMNQISKVADIVTLGKGLTAGLCPLAATVASQAVYEAFLSNQAEQALMHGPTYMGHALGCSAALASIELFETKPRLAQALAIEAYLEKHLMGLANHPKVKQVRVKGAMGVVELHHSISVKTLQALKAYYLTHECWIRPFGSIIYLTPALIISEAEMSKLISSIVGSLALIEL